MDWFHQDTPFKACVALWMRIESIRFQVKFALANYLFLAIDNRVRDLKFLQTSSHPKVDLHKPKAVKKLLKAVQNAPFEKVTPVAAGYEQRIVNSELTGSYLTLENRLVHLGLTV